MLNGPFYAFFGSKVAANRKLSLGDFFSQHDHFGHLLF